jgi:hypothetical protein
MKDQLKLAIVTTSQEHYSHYLTQNNLDPENCKKVSILRDVQGFVFCGKENIDGHANVCDAVKRQIVIVEPIIE